MIVGSKNKGDWSEFYVLLYLLGTRKIYAADENLNRIGTFCFPINGIIRDDDASHDVRCVLDGVKEVNIYLNSVLTRTMTSEDFVRESAFLYDEIKKGKGSFNIPHGETLLNWIGLERLAAPSAKVADIKLNLHDTNTGINQVMGFSIKSYIGSPPTLLNASEATNFIYEIKGINAEQAEEINAINTQHKILDRMHAIADCGGQLCYCKTENETFAKNLMMIDSRMEEILAEIVVYSYKSNQTVCMDILEHMEEINPLKYPRAGMYIYKFKQFLCAKALGMDPAKEWNGEDSANGGYIVAKDDGDVLAYHLYNRDKFKHYLYENTKLDRGSTSKHKYASVYSCNGKYYIKLNLQIRFK